MKNILELRRTRLKDQQNNLESPHGNAMKFQPVQAFHLSLAEKKKTCEFQFNISTFYLFSFVFCSYFTRKL